MRTVITGGAGFVARALAARMNALGEAGDIVLVDRVPPPAAPGCVCVEADLGSVAHMAQAIDGADRVIHLAALPGGASEKHPAQSRAINLDMSLNLLEAVTRSSHPVRLVYTSSIAVFGAPLPDHIDDTTIPRPSMTYGTHKLMVEAALTDAVRRGANAIALQVAGHRGTACGRGWGEIRVHEQTSSTRSGRVGLMRFRCHPRRRCGCSRLPRARMPCCRQHRPCFRRIPLPW